MPTKKRITVPGACVHIMARGISGTDIFSDDEDRRMFLSLLSLGIGQNGYLCYAWTLMSNHYHLLVRSSENPLERLMRRLNSRYAQYHNNKTGRKGYLFQDRYKSIITQDQHYLEELIRYIHLNPLRAGICKTMDELDRYPWCGHAALVGTIANTFQSTDAVLRRFGAGVDEARRRYKDFLLQGIDNVDDDWLLATVRNCNAGVEDRDRPECWVIGDREFVVSVMKKNEQRLRMSRAAREQWSLDTVCAKIASDHGLSVSDLQKKSRSLEISEVKKKFAFICCRVLQFPVVMVADYLGVSGPAVSWAINEGKKIAKPVDLANFTNLPPG